MRKYNTKQGQMILDCLTEHSRKHLTAEEIVDYLKIKGQGVGRTTVYRQLDKLVQEGLVLKFSGPEGGSSCYQLGQSSSGDGCQNHYHLVCTRCGRLRHLSCHHLEESFGHIGESHDFHIDRCQTVFYGVCGGCQVSRRKEELKE